MKDVTFFPTPMLCGEVYWTDADALATSTGPEQTEDEPQDDEYEYEEFSTY